MRIITFDKIRDLNISPLQCYEWVEEIISKKGNAILPAKISMKPGAEGVFFNCMPSILTEFGWAGVKMVTRYPLRNPSLDSEILLYDLKSGEALALLDGDYITTMRTGAVAAHSIKLLANAGFHEIGMMGLGNTARATLKILLSLYPTRNFVIRLLKYKDQHISFEQRFAEYDNIEFIECETPQEVVTNSEVIISAVTVFEEDICENECFREGCLVVPIHTRGFANCDLFFDKVFADDTNHVKGFKYFNQFRSFGEVSAVINGEIPGRTDSKERILAYNIGIAAHDIFFSGKINELIAECEEISLNSPKEKFWI